MAVRTVFQRKDKTWGWRLAADNGQIIAGDAGQGYENEGDARAIADRVVNGEFKNAKRLRAPLPEK